MSYIAGFALEGRPGQEETYRAYENLVGRQLPVPLVVRLTFRGPEPPSEAQVYDVVQGLQQAARTTWEGEAITVLHDPQDPKYPTEGVHVALEGEVPPRAPRPFARAKPGKCPCLKARASGGDPCRSDCQCASPMHSGKCHACLVGLK